MKKILLLFLTLVGMVSTVSAEGVIYLRNNISTNWDTDDNNFKSEKSWDNTNKQDVYTFTINASALGTSDFFFRINRWDSDGNLIGPYNHSDYKFTFPDGCTETYTAPRIGQFQGENGAFCIEHSKIKANEYRITIYLKYSVNIKVDDTDYNDVWCYYIKVEIVDMPVTMATEGKGTFCCDRALDFSGTGINAYLITGVASSGVLATSDPLTYVPANTPLYVVGSTANIPVVTTEAASEVNVSENKLKQGTGVAVPETESTNINFILTNKTTTNPSAPLKFYRANDNVVPSNKAYLQLPSEIVLAREFVWFDDEATAVNVVKKEQKFDGKVFNLAGQRIANPTKGLFIVNGKKVIK